MSEQWVNPEYADVVERANQMVVAPGLFRAFLIPAGDEGARDEGESE